jgi:uncharacterized protein (TIGR02145 family)
MKKFALLVFVVMGILTCSNNQSTVPQTATVVPTILWKTPAQDGIPAGVDSVKITISSSSLSSSLVKTFSYGDSKGTIPSIPVDISITITIEGIDSLGHVLYRGSVDVPKVTAPTMDITIDANKVTPIAPSDLVAQSLSYNSIRLIWKENSTNETYYLIGRQTNGFAAWDSIGIATQNTFTDTTLAPVTPYQYKIIAVNGAGRSAATTPAAATTLILDRAGPLVTISSFKKIDTVNTHTVTLYGTIRDTSGVYQLTINNVIAEVSGDQWIAQHYYLADTVNTLVVKATDNSTFKNVTLDTLTLIYKSTFIDTTNHAPRFTVTSDSMKATVKVGQTYKKVLRGFDGDANDTIRFIVSGTLLLIGKDTVEWMPTTADTGSRAFYALVYDKKQAHDSIGWTITVLDSTTQIPNHNPVFVTIVSEITDSVGQNMQYIDTLVAKDEDNDPKLTFSVVTFPQGLTIGSTTGIVTWTPTTSGTFPVSAYATDDSGAQASIAWDITVVPATVKVNHPPQFVTKTMDMTRTATVGILYKDTVTARDPDSGDVLRFSVINSPITVDSVTGIVTWTPSTRGNYSMIVSVTDDSGKHVELTWPVTVLEAQGTVSDIDGNVYHTVTIGTQIWMVENLRTTKYNDGTAIPLVTDNAAWAALTTPGYCWYNNDAPTYGTTYGALYNWYAVNTGKLAPTGWHVPTDSEWTVLITYLGGDSIAGGKLKEVGTAHWAGPNKGATNTSGFTALPSGNRLAIGTFDYIGGTGIWWSSTANNAATSYYRSMGFNSGDVGHNSFDNIFGFSVRCVKGDPVPMVPKISSVTPGDGSVRVIWDTVSGAKSYNLYYAGGTAVTMSNGTKVLGAVSPRVVTGLINGKQYAFAVSAVNLAGESMLSAVKTATPLASTVAPTITDHPQSQTVTVGQNVTFNVTATGTSPLSYQWFKGGLVITGATSSSYSISNVQTTDRGTYTVRISNGTLPDATSNGAVLTVNPASATVTDVDGNVYHTITIGTQIWMVENLKSTRYNDGTAIPLVTDSAAWPLLTTPGYCWYKNDAAFYGSTYGALYNWYAVNTSKLAPTGWHVPTDSEWSVLTTFLGGETVAGDKLKEAGTTHWNTPNAGATNGTGFSALPGGSMTTGVYSSNGLVGDWWSSTVSSGQSSWFRSMGYNSTGVTRIARPWFYGFSVRCIRDP